MVPLKHRLMLDHMGYMLCVMGIALVYTLFFLLHYQLKHKNVYLCRLIGPIYVKACLL